MDCLFSPVRAEHCTAGVVRPVPEAPRTGEEFQLSPALLPLVLAVLLLLLSLTGAMRR